MEMIQMALIAILAVITIPTAFFFVYGLVERIHSINTLSIQRDNNISRNIAIGNSGSMDKVAGQSASG